MKEIDFYYPLFSSIAKVVDELHIMYAAGVPNKEWEDISHLHRLELNSALRSITFQFMLSRRSVLNQIGAIDADVMFALSELWTLQLSSYCSGKLHIPFVIWIRGDHRKVRETRRVSWRKRAMIDYLETRYLNKAALVMPNSLSLLEKLEKWGVSKEKITEPIHNCVDSTVFKPLMVDRSDKFTVAYAGRIVSEKRVDKLLKIAEELPEVDFIVAGGKSMEVSFPSNVQYFGRLPLQDMPTFYNKADLLALPSATEGFPSVILEAYACGKPVLVTPEAFPKELELFGAVADIEEFGPRIKELQNSDLASAGKSARDYVKMNFQWARFGEEIKKCLTKAISTADPRKS